MKPLFLSVGLAILVCGCATKPPPPPPVIGEFRPINLPPMDVPERNIPLVFNFKYSGPVEVALIRLQEVQPQLVVTDSKGQRMRAAKVRLDLRQVTLEKALKVMGEQSDGSYRIVYRPDLENKRDFAYIQYNGR